MALTNNKNSTCEIRYRARS